MQKGKINVTTENIFPIIKKFLYSDHEIFLRELISNAVDATQKLKALASLGEFKGELGDLTIRVNVNKKKKTILNNKNWALQIFLRISTTLKLEELIFKGSLRKPWYLINSFRRKRRIINSQLKHG